MTSSAARATGKAFGKRVSGQKPGPIRAIVAATVVGVGVAILTYRLLRSG
jgi:hypothetical protein